MRDTHLRLSRPGQSGLSAKGYDADPAQGLRGDRNLADLYVQRVLRFWSMKMHDSLINGSRPLNPTC